MLAAPMRFLSAAAWPLTIWSSLSQFGNHAADDYVERTFPIVATAIAFWVCVAGLVYFNLTGVTVVTSEAGEAVRFVSRSGMQFAQLLWLFAPVIYIVGFWLYAAREERYRG